MTHRSTTETQCADAVFSGGPVLTMANAGPLAESVAIGADPPVHYRGMLVSSEYDAWSQMGLRPDFGDDLFRVDGIKAWSDGSNQAGTGYQREPYLEQALAAHPRPHHRHRIEHCSVLRPEHMTRMAASGLSPSFLIGHIRWWGTAFRDRLLGPERAAFYDPCASALRAGLRISLHSDWNVTPLEPLRYVQDAVTRIMAENGEVLEADERIPVVAALRAVTLDAAWQCRSEQVTGSIQVGKYADLVLLEDDPTAVEPTAIADIAVSETRLAGTIRYSS